jgi:L-2-hydroxyglutarate oxidase
VQNRVVVIGGGLVGLGTARALQRAAPGVPVELLEKESEAGQHQSTHNSGVLHSGLYYAPGSARALLARRGIRSMTAFCEEHGIAHEICGKLVVAASEDEVPRLQALFERGKQNGLIGLEWLSPEAAHEIEPHVRCVAAVRVPEEGIADYAAVVRKQRELFERDGGTFRASAPVRALQRSTTGWRISAGTAEIEATFIVNCAGLHSDRIARLAGERPDSQIVPFRGEYFGLRPERIHLARHLIYPVPDPTFPFLGVHFTRMIGGGMECGPNAVLAFAREGYRMRDVNLRDALEALAFPGLWRFMRKYPRTTILEVARSISKRLFTKTLQRLIPEIEGSDLVAGGAGVRAQAMSRDGSLIQDFVFMERKDALHVLNAPSPAATASIAIGEEVATKVVAALGL